VSSIRYTERPNNTPEQVRDYLREALAIVEELAPPEDLREVAFGKAVDLTSSKQLTAEQIVAGGALLNPRL
jgi:hypothetical protein